MKSYLTLLLLIAGYSSASVHAAVVTLGADKDTSIFQNNVNNAGGGGPGLFAGTNGGNSPRRALISFDLSSIPAGSTITDVQITLTLGQVSSMISQHVDRDLQRVRTLLDFRADLRNAIVGTGQRHIILSGLEDQLVKEIYDQPTLHANHIARLSRLDGKPQRVRNGRLR